MEKKWERVKRLKNGKEAGNDEVITVFVASFCGVAECLPHDVGRNFSYIYIYIYSPVGRGT